MSTWLMDLLGRVWDDLYQTVAADWPYLLASILAAAALTVFLGPDRLQRILGQHRLASTVGAVLLAVLTPFCSCGTTAVVLGMVASRAPWAPIVAFMVASPLTSPGELVLSAGLFGWPFALVFFVGSIVLGLAAGAITALLERRTGWLVGQARMRVDGRPVGNTCSANAASRCREVPASATDHPSEGTSGTGTLVAAPGAPTRSRHPAKLAQFTSETVRIGRKVAGYFLAYTALGYLLIELVPTDKLIAALGGNGWWSVPLAAVVGLPVYLTTEASLPMVAALLHGGLGTGAAMAFLVTGAGTCVGAISGALLIARRRVVGLVVALLLAGGILLGWVTPVLVS